MSNTPKPYEIIEMIEDGVQWFIIMRPLQSVGYKEMARVRDEEAHAEHIVQLLNGEIGARR